MEISGRLVQTLSIVTGQSAKGEWRKQDFIIETLEQYPKKICLTAWKDKVDEVNNLEIGETITCHINIESKEHNGQYYTNITAYKIEKTVTPY